MFLAALVDAGVPFSVLESAVSGLDLGGRLQMSRVDRSGISSAKIDVVTSDGAVAELTHATSHSHAHAQDDHEHGHSHGASHDLSDHMHSHGTQNGHTHQHGRSLVVIRELILGSSLHPEVQATALKAFQLLGEAEAKIHNIPVENIHFHEVGAVDAIADIVATAAGCHWLQIDRWLCSSLNVGGGHVHCAHGKFPVPAPATLELLNGLPIYSSGVKKELVTPTGAALLRALEVTSSNFPSMSVQSTGYGAGSRDLTGQPNVLRLVIGEMTEPVSRADALPYPEPAKSHADTKVGIIETTIDDATPEVLSYVADKLLAAGASDVYRTAIQMKKGRTGIQLTILCSPSKAEDLQRLVFEETTTLGLRYREEVKKTLSRTFTAVETQWGEVRIKIGLLNDGTIVNYAPEYEDCRILAEANAVPLKQVMQAAMSAYITQGTNT
jgi:uncharacterized protein (TIGR00299 family) protein